MVQPHQQPFMVRLKFALAIRHYHRAFERSPIVLFTQTCRPVLHEMVYHSPFALDMFSFPELLVYHRVGMDAIPLEGVILTSELPASGQPAPQVPQALMARQAPQDRPDRRRLPHPALR